MHHPGVLGAQRAEHVRQGLHPGGVVDAEELAPRAGRVGERAQQVEHGAEAQLDADRRHVAHGGVEGGGEEEAHAGFLQGAHGLSGLGLHPHAKRRQHVGGAGAGGKGSGAVLGHLGAGACGHEGGGGGDVEGLQAVAARAAGVDHLEAGIEAEGGGAQGLGEGGDLPHRLAPHAQGGEGGGDLGGGGLAVQAGAHESVGLLGRKRAAAGELRQDGLQRVGHGGIRRRASPRPGRCRTAAGSWRGGRGHARWRGSRGGTARRGWGARDGGSP